MKKQWFSIIASILSASAALFLCVTWRSGPAVPGMAVAAPLDAIPMPPTLAEDPAVPSGEVGPTGVGSVANSAADAWTIECVDCPKYFAEMSDRSLRLDAEGHPHIAYGSDRLYYARHDGMTWQLQVADSTPGVGLYAALALDSTPPYTPHISYYDDVNGDLRYAYWTGSTWVSQTVDDVGDVGEYTSLALDANSTPHISYYDRTNRDLKHAYWAGSTWVSQTVDSQGDVGEYTSLALDMDGNPHISYYDATNGNLKHADWTGSIWVSQTVDSAPTVGKYASLALDTTAPYTPHISYLATSNWGGTWFDLKYATSTGSGWISETVDSTGDVGLYSSLALDADGSPHISYYDSTSDRLKYARWTGSTWDKQITDDGGSISVNVGQYSSLALDTTGNAHISYFNSSSNDLLYAHWTGSTWDKQVVDSRGDVGEYTSLALDAGDNPHISYYDDINYDLKYAYWTGSAWVTQTVDSQSSRGQYTSLAVSAEGTPHISYYEATYHSLRHAYFDASGWHSETVDGGPSTEYVGQYNSLVLDGEGYPHISYYEEHKSPQYRSYLRYAYQDASGWHVETAENPESSGRYPGLFTSLALDGNDYPHISYFHGSDNELKYAYKDIAGWHVETVDSAGTVGKYTSLELDNSGYAHISYFDDSKDDLKYAYQDALGWHIETVDSVGGVGQYTSLALDGNGRPLISYYGGTDVVEGHLRYARWNGSQWLTETVDGTGGVGQYTSLMLDGNGKAHISYYDAKNHDLKYAYYSAQLAAGFSAAPTYGFAPLTVAFTDVSTGSVDTWLWSFGDGITSTQQSPTHTYTVAGAYTVTLAVGGPGGTDTSTRTDLITVYEAVRADFTANPVHGVSPLVVKFTDTSSGPVAVWRWNLGDGTISALQHPTHTYTKTGVYTVGLTAQVVGASAVLPGGTDTLTRTHYITVTESPPQVDFTGHPRSGAAPLTVQFTSTVTGTATDYQWNFGDGGVADTANPTHTYHSAGSFGVILAVTGPGGMTNVSKPGYITVNAAPGAPTATFSADVVSGTAPLTVTFTAATSGTVEHWLWSFGNGDTAFTGPVVSHTYVTSDTFDVSLTVSNTHGSFIVSKPGYITVRTRDEESHAIYLPLVLRSTP
jgi:PKD repeat protein